MSDLHKHTDRVVAGQPAPDLNPSDDLLARLQDLLEAFWPAATTGDVKSGELVLRVLRQQADMYGLRGKVALPVDEGVDELAKLRARRAGP